MPVPIVLLPALPFTWNTRLFAAALPLVLAAKLAFAVRHRERNHRAQRRNLSDAVTLRTEELHRQSERERERSRVLEMLIANEPLGTFLDRVLLLLQSEAPASACAVLLKQGPHCRVAASSAFPDDWLTAIQMPEALPPEVWQAPARWHLPASNPLWKLFHDNIEREGPCHIRSWPVTSGPSGAGALLQCWPVALAGSPPPWNNPALLDTAEAASRIVTLALEHNRLYDDLRFQIRHDALTGLANRMLFEERLGRALREAEQRRRKLAVLFVDLDHFKQVNDELNHRAGDLYLCEMANRMKNAVRSLDLVARIGGDEFIVMLPHVRDAEEAVGVAERLLAAIQKPLRLEGRELSPTASAGLALYPDDAPTADQLQRFAGLAMHSARQAGCGQVHTFSQRNETLDRARLEEVLRLALRDGRFVVHYQAKASPTGRFMGFEALLRLNHPERGLVQPLEFIPTAERSGLIVPIGAWVLEEVCRQIAAWRDRGFGEMAVAVNVSTLQLDRPDFVAAVMTCLRRSGVAPWHLELELTESILITGSECALRQMRELRALGVRLSIDDFGTGYSSLGYLHRLEIDTVKLDRSFVQPIEKDNMARWLVQAMIGIAQGLGLGVIAEGVETEGQRDALVAAGCPVMQGFLFAKPASAQDLEPLLALLADDLPLRADIVPSGPAEAGAEALMVALGGER